MTENMKEIFMDIVASFRSIPIERRFYIFGEDEREDYNCINGVAEYIILEYIKYAFDKMDPVYSLRHFLGKDAEDCDRMAQTRIMQYVMKYKKQELQNRNKTLPLDHKFANTNMETIEQKIKGYHLTCMNYFEQQNINDLEIIKAFTENRIGYAKKIPNERFERIFEQYDAFVKKLKERSLLSDDDMIFASLAFFTLECHFPFELLYKLTLLMEHDQITDIDSKSLILLCGNITIDSQFGGTYHTDSRMVKERCNMLVPLFSKQFSINEKEYAQSVFKEIIALVVIYKESLTCSNGEYYKDWFRKNTTQEDWASFLREYNLFDTWQKKEWTGSRIQTMRKLINVITIKK